MLAVPIAAACIMAYTLGVPGVPQDSDKGLLDGTIMLTYLMKYGVWMRVGACGISVCSMDSEPLCRPDCALCPIRIHVDRAGRDCMAESNQTPQGR